MCTCISVLSPNNWLFDRFFRLLLAFDCGDISFFAIAENAISSYFGGYTWNAFKERKAEKNRQKESERNTSTISWSNINSCNVVSIQIISSLACNVQMYWLNIFISIRYLDFPYILHYACAFIFETKFFSSVYRWRRNDWERKILKYFLPSTHFWRTHVRDGIPNYLKTLYS